MILTTTLEHVTITVNSADEVGGLALLAFDDDEIVIENTLIGNNTATDAPDCSNAGVTVMSQGTNLLSIDEPLDGEMVCLTDPPDLVGTATDPLDPLLGPLADNGGPTPTHALLLDSPALDAASDQGETVDQRNVTRPQGSAFDIGAFEASPEDLAALLADLTLTKTADGTGNQVTFFLTAVNLGPADAEDVVIEDPLPAGLAFVSALPSLGGLCSTPAPGSEGGTVTCTFPGLTAPMEQRTVTIEVLVTSPTVAPNVATVSSDTPEPDPDPNPNVATAAIDVLVIPTLDEWGLLLLTIVLAGVGVFVIRR